MTLQSQWPPRYQEWISSSVYTHKEQNRPMSRRRFKVLCHTRTHALWHIYIDQKDCYGLRSIRTVSTRTSKQGLTLLCSGVHVLILSFNDTRESNTDSSHVIRVECRHCMTIQTDTSWNAQTNHRKNATDVARNNYMYTGDMSHDDRRSLRRRRMYHHRSRNRKLLRPASSHSKRRRRLVIQRYKDQR